MRTNINDTPRLAPRGSIPERGFRMRYQTKWGNDIDFMQFLPYIRRGRQDIRMRNYATDAGVIDQHVESPPHGNCFADKPLPVRLISQVGLHIRPLGELAGQRMPCIDRTARMQNDSESLV
ncbi:hypothetical protein GCM10027278_18910 [Paralcaligenes ginsengisoli]